jgi:hypothetical protein
VSAGPSVEELTREIEAERARLVDSVSALRAEIEQKRRSGLRVGLPVIAGAAVAGFVLAGGVRATIRLLGVRYRRRREQADGRVLALLRR